MCLGMSTSKTLSMCAGSRICVRFRRGAARVLRMRMSMDIRRARVLPIVAGGQPQAGKLPSGPKEQHAYRVMAYIATVPYSYGPI